MIHTRGLARDFRTKSGTVHAVTGLDLDVEAGEMLAFLGPNGAGKSTSLRMLTTLLAPTAGTAEVAGRDVAADPAGVRARIGYVAQGRSGAEDQRVGDELVTQGRFHGMSKAEARRRAGDLLDLFDLSGTERRTVGTLSGGQQRRLDIAIGLIHRPGLLFLDEPSTGLDPQSRAALLGHIRRLHDEDGTTVFLTTHYLDEADSLAERVVIVDGGRAIADGTPDALKGKVSGDLVAFGTAGPEQARAAAEVLAATSAAGTGSDAGPEASGSEVRLRVDRGDEALPGLLRALDAAAVPFTTVRVQRPSLDDVFLDLTGRSLREGA
ncbi:ATP-binding cassette domain-containing protein [Nocardiopsis coralliicola]